MLRSIVLWLIASLISSSEPGLWPRWGAARSAPTAVISRNVGETQHQRGGCCWGLLDGGNWLAEDGRSRSSFTEDGYWWLILLLSSVAVSLCVHVQVPCWSSRVDFALVLVNWWYVDLWIYRLIYLSPPLNAIPLTKLREYQQPKLPDALTIVFACEGLSPRLWKSVATTLSIVNHQQWWSSADYSSRFLSPKEFFHGMSDTDTPSNCLFQAQKRSAHLFAIHRNARPLVVSWLQTSACLKP